MFSPHTAILSPPPLPSLLRVVSGRCRGRAAHILSDRMTCPATKGLVNRPSACAPAGLYVCLWPTPAAVELAAGAERWCCRWCWCCALVTTVSSPVTTLTSDLVSADVVSCHAGIIVTVSWRYHAVARMLSI